MSRIDKAAIAARYLSRSIGREVTIQSLTLSPGWPTRIEIRGVSVANMQGGSQPEMVSLANLTAEVEPWSLLFGPVVFQHLSLDGAHLLLEHGQKDLPNWKFDTARPILPEPEGRRLMPTLLDARLHNVAIDIRTSSAATLRLHIDDGTVAAAAPDKPVSFKIEGSYNGISFRGDAALPAFMDLHSSAKNFPVSFKIDSGMLSLAFEGTSADPLNADGLNGRMILNAPKPRELLAIAGFAGKLDLPLTLSGNVSRNDTLWQISGGMGVWDGDMFTTDLKMQEGKRHEPDDITLDAGFDRLDLDALASGTPQPPGKTSLLVDPDPGMLLDAHVAAAHLTYRTIQAEEFDLKAKLSPGKLAVEQIAANIAGGSARSKIVVTNRDGKGVVEFDGALTGVDVVRLAKVMGWGVPPLSGPLSSRVSGTMTGATLAEARGANQISVVLSMADGTFDRELVRMASTDIRSLFGGDNKLSRLSCLLGVVNLRDGRGTIAPLTIRTADGTIVGGGVYDAQRDAIDVTVATQSKTTSFFALDVPVRISGPLSNFSVRPVFGGSRSPSVTDNIGDLPADLRSFATSNPCWRH